ncbi:hypothetical protein Hdeb2414_s0008g00289881 [Helianthus debilis subsp. tardiflorus]
MIFFPLSFDEIEFCRFVYVKLVEVRKGVQYQNRSLICLYINISSIVLGFRIQ